MKVSLNFVSKFVDLNGLNPEEIAHRFTFAGVEVESIEKLGQGTKLVVGEVLTCENMPDPRATQNRNRLPCGDCGHGLAWYSRRCQGPIRSYPSVVDR